MWFSKKKQEAEVKKTEVFNWSAFADLKEKKNNNSGDKEFKFEEPTTMAKVRLEGGANDFGSKKARSKYEDHKVKIQNQWVNPLQSVNSGFGNAQDSYYLYQSVNYYECYSLAQDPLFNKIFNILSKTPFANGGEVVSDLSEEQLDVLDNSIKKYDLYNTFVKALRSTYVCGGCLLYMDFGDEEDLEEPLDIKKVNLKKFKGFVHIDPINLVAIDVNTTNPASRDYMKPKSWYVVGLGTVHASRFLKFEDNLPELIMRPMTLYFGMPLTLLIKQDVSNSNLASQGLANLMNRCRYLYLKTEGDNFYSDAAVNFRQRLEAMSLVQDNFGIYPLKSTEDMFQLTMSLNGMDQNAEFFYQIIASKTDITLSILLGKGAQGLSGTLEGERKNFYDRMRAEQEMIKPNLLKALGIIYGATTDGKFYEFQDYIFNPLEQSDEKEKAENMRSYMEVAKGLIEAGVSNEDVLSWLKKYKDFNLQNVEIDADAEGMIGYEEEGEEEKDKIFNSEFDYKVAFVMREFAEGKLKDSHGNTVTDKDQALAIAYSEAKKKVSNAEFDESEHPRDKSGQFTKKGAGEVSGEKESGHDNLIEINGKKRNLLNSEGKKISDSKKSIENFYNWFGNSKVVDEEGRPLVVYHGTDVKNLEYFDKEKGYSATDSIGSWFGKNKKIAEQRVKDRGGNGEVYSLYLSIQNPIIVQTRSELNKKIAEKMENVSEEEDLIEMLEDDIKNYPKEYDISLEDLTLYKEKRESDEIRIKVNEIILNHMDPAFRDELKDPVRKALEGYDGVIVKDDYGFGESYVAFDSEQIKSLDNNGDFNKESKKIKNGVSE